MSARLWGRAGALVTTLVLTGAVGGVAQADTVSDPASGQRSNLGLCSPYLGSLPPPVDPVTGEALGGNARSGVNLLILRYGESLPDHLANPGQLYSVRAHEHPTTTAAEECLPRPRP